MKNLILQKFLKISLFKITLFTFTVLLITMLYTYDGHIGAPLTISATFSLFVTSIVYLNKVADKFYDRALYIEDKIAHLTKNSDPKLFDEIRDEILELQKTCYDPHSRAKIRQLKVLLNYIKK